MKRIILSIILVSHFFNSNSQTLIVSGSTTVNPIGGDPNMTTNSYLVVKNNTGSILNVLCEKKIISMPDSTGNQFCWGEDCYPDMVLLSSNSWALNPAINDSSFIGYYMANGSLDPAIIEYCFYPENTVSDSTCVTITYNTNVTGLLENKSLSNIVFYPNPAINYTTIAYNKEDNMVLRIIDILGNQVKNIPLNNSESHHLYVGDLTKGIYFGKLEHDNKLIEIKKLIIK